MNRPIDCRSLRRFGVEVELNTLDGVIRRPDSDAGEIPDGADYVACIVKKASKGKVEIAAWDYVHNNDNWVMKHDMSCGMEINSPVLKGWHGLKKLLRVVEDLSKDKKIKADQLCSLHVHVSIDDLNLNELAAVIAYYIKCEHVFFDSVPSQRKNNRYCQCVSMTDWYDTNFEMEPMDIITSISHSKYGSINTFHFIRGGAFSVANDRRKTIEFRIAENTACLDPFFVKNWIRFLLHFIEVTKNKKIPKRYINGDQYTGLAWLDFPDVYRLLKFDKPLSFGMQQVRQWFMDRINQNGIEEPVNSVVWSKAGRTICRNQFLEINSNLSRTNNDEDILYGEKYII
jgi:hypothetical protein